MLDVRGKLFVRLKNMRNWFRTVGNVEEDYNGAYSNCRIRTIEIHFRWEYKRVEL